MRNNKSFFYVHVMQIKTTLYNLYITQTGFLERILKINCDYENV